MQLTTEHFARLQQFFDKIQGETYPEPPSDLHTGISDTVFKRLMTQFPLPAKATVLDVGCGQGVALKRFLEAGLAPVGIALNPTDVAQARAQGYDVREMDQSF